MFQLSLARYQFVKDSLRFDTVTTALEKNRFHVAVLFDYSSTASTALHSGLLGNAIVCCQLTLCSFSFLPLWSFQSKGCNQHKQNHIQFSYVILSLYLMSCIVVLSSGFYTDFPLKIHFIKHNSRQTHSNPFCLGKDILLSLLYAQNAIFIHLMPSPFLQQMNALANRYRYQLIFI